MADANTLTDTYTQEQFGDRYTLAKLVVVSGFLAVITAVSALRGDYGVALLSATVAIDYAVTLPRVVAVAGYLSAGVLFFVTASLPLLAGRIAGALLVAALIETNLVSRVTS